MRLQTQYGQLYSNRGVMQHHSGIDLEAEYHEPVYSYWSGTVCHVGPLPGFGHTVCVDHGNGTWSRYAHLGGYRVRVGQVIPELHWIGVVGLMENMSIHLHVDYTIVDLGKNPAHWPDTLPEVLTLYKDPMLLLRS